MSEFPKRASKLSEVAAAVELTPLESGDSRYVDISAGRGGSKDLTLMRLCLQDHDARDNHFAKIAFTGHRGSGKSTELLRMEHEISRDFTSLHLYADEALLGDYDYTDLLLWLVDELMREFLTAGTPLNSKLAEEVATWFAEVTLGQIEQVKSEILAETEAKAEGKAGLFWLSFGLMARLKSMVTGSNERRKEIRSKLKNKSTELIARVNLLLDDAYQVLERHKKPANLLIVVDNLDRLPPEVSGPLFFENGGFLKQLRAHVIYTVPIASVLAPMNIGLIFENKFTLSMVKVHDEIGKVAKNGLDAMVEAVAKRVEVDSIFARKQDVRELAKQSGGSVRDLMRLIQIAQLIARADDKGKIDAASVKQAVRKIRLDFERMLIPGRVYYPLLVQIHLVKSDVANGLEGSEPQKVQSYRDFFSELLFNGSVLEYNGDRMWYDVHPVIQEIDAFKKALADVQSPSQDKARSPG